MVGGLDDPATRYVRAGDQANPMNQGSYSLPFLPLK